MIYKMLVFVIFLFHVVSCMNTTGSNIVPEKKDIGYDKSACIDLNSNMNDTVFKSINGFLIYEHISIDYFLVKWGKSNSDMLYCDTLPMFPIGTPLYQWHNEEAICLRQGCGTDCFFAYILLFKAGEIKRYMYPMAYDTLNNVIAYADSNVPEVFLVVENFLTGEKKEIIEDYLRGIHSGHSIESIRFNQNGLFVKWQDCKNETREKIFK